MEELTDDEQDELLRFIECATRNNWPRIVNECRRNSVHVKTVCDTLTRLAEAQGVDPPVTEEDFKRG